MTGIRQRSIQGLGMLLILAMLLGLVGPAAADVIGGGLTGLPDHDDYIMNASLTVSTQKKAYKINNGIRGIDVSKYQGDINWSQVAQDNVEFAFIRSSYGMINDPYFFLNASKAHENGVKVGAYHFATFKTSAEVKKEAEYFVSRLKKVNITYPVVLDLEGASHKKIARSTLTSLAIEFMELIKAEGYHVMLYTYNNFLRDHLDAAKLEGYDLWIANYLEHPAAYSHKVWQHSSTGKISGIKGNVDLNVAYEDLSTRKRLTIDSEVSSSIKQTLNDRYGVGLPLDSLDMTQMNEAITTGLQYEIGWQWGIDYPVTGYPDSEMIDYLASVNYTAETRGNIMYLVQTKLVYLGYYKSHPSSWNDEETRDAIGRFQSANNMNGDGYLDWNTLSMLFLY